MIKKIIITFMCVILSGCIGPKYISHTQKIDLDIPENAFVEYLGEELETKGNKLHLDISRSWFDKEIIIKKEGFKDYHLKLDSVWTDEKWAEKGMDFGGNGPTPLSAAVLLTFPNTRMMGGDVFSVPNPLAWLIGTPILVFPSILGDILNLGIHVPGVLILNPWKKYKYDSDIVLEPTEEFKEQCHKNKGSFFSSDGCTNCDFTVNVYSSPEECSRCPNREMQGKYCILNKCPDKFFRAKNGACYSCDEAGRFKTEDDECQRCKNRKVDSFYEEDDHYHNYCILQKCPKGYFRSNSGSCYSCNDIRTIPNVDWDKCVVVCPNREWSNKECSLKK